MTTARWLSLVAFSMLLAGCGGSKAKGPTDQAKKPDTAPAGAGDEEFLIKLTVPFKVGAKRTVDRSGKQVLERTMEKDGKVDKQQKSTNRLEFKAVVETLEVDQLGRETKMEIKIERFVLIPEGEKEQEALPAGTLVIAETKDGRAQYRPKDKDQKLSRLAEHLLPRTLTTAASGSTEEQAFQTNKPQKVGATWPADKKLLGEHFKTLGSPTEGPSGTGKLVGVKTLNGKKYLQLELTMAMETGGLALDDPFLVPRFSSLNAVRTILIPADYSTGPIEESMEVKMKQVLTGKDGSPQKGLVMDGRSVDSWTSKTVYLSK